MIGPALSADLDVVAATMIAAINQNIAHAGGAHFAERDFLLVGCWSSHVSVGFGLQ
jgi:hypothetical protein